MSAPVVIKSKPIEVGHGYSVEFTYDGLPLLHCEWSPKLPNDRRLRQVWPGYREARASFLAHVARQLRINVALVDL